MLAAAGWPVMQAATPTDCLPAAAGALGARGCQHPLLHQRLGSRPGHPGHRCVRLVVGMSGLALSAALQSLFVLLFPLLAIGCALPLCRADVPRVGLDWHEIQPHPNTGSSLSTPHVPPSCLPPPAALTATGQIDGYLASLEHLQRYGCLPTPPTSKTASGQTVVDVFPTVGRQGAGG